MKRFLLSVLMLSATGALADEVRVRTPGLINELALHGDQSKPFIRSLGLEEWKDSAISRGAGTTYGNPRRTTANSHQLNKVELGGIFVDRETGLMRIEMRNSYQEVSRHAGHRIDPPYPETVNRYVYINDPEKRIVDDPAKIRASDKAKFTKLDWSKADASFLPEKWQGGGNLKLELAKFASAPEAAPRARGRGKLGKAGKAAVIAVPAAAVGAVMMKGEAQAGAIREADLPNKDDVESRQQQDIKVLDAN